MKELLKRVTNTIITLSHISHIHELKRQWVMRGNNIKAKLWGKRDWMKNQDRKIDGWDKNGCVWVSYCKVVSKNKIRSFHVHLKQFLYSNMTREWKAELNVIREPYCFLWWISGYLKMCTYCAHTAVVRFWLGIWLYMDFKWINWNHKTDHEWFF